MPAPKPLEKIKHGQKVVDSMVSGTLYFVDDIRRATSLDDKTMPRVLNQLLKNKYIEKNDRGQWKLRDE